MSHSFPTRRSSDLNSYNSDRINDTCRSVEKDEGSSSEEIIVKWLSYCKKRFALQKDFTLLLVYSRQSGVKLNQVAITQEEALEIIKKFSTKSDTKKKTVREVIKTINVSTEKLYFDWLALLPEKIDIKNKQLARKITSLKGTKKYSPNRVSTICLAADKETTEGDVLKAVSKFCNDFITSRSAVSKLQAFNRNNTNLNQNNAEVSTIVCKYIKI